MARLGLPLDDARQRTSTGMVFAHRCEACGAAVGFAIELASWDVAFCCECGIRGLIAANGPFSRVERVYEPVVVPWRRYVAPAMPDTVEAAVREARCQN